MKQPLILLCLASALSAAAQNPIITDQFTADPTARVFSGKLYLYPSHDIVPPEAFARKDWFCMEDYHVFSSDNLSDWHDHGVIVTQAQVPWGKPDAYSMWAPDCVEKGGTYYFYFPNAPRDGRGFAIGVATATKPEGPFTLEPEPIKGVSGIDPCVLVDTDGQAYIYWSGMGIRGARLKANMKEVDGELQAIKVPAREGQPERPAMLVAGEEMKGLPEGFKEGPFAFRRGDWYYLTFPWVRGSKEGGANPTETLAYAMSKSPLGPWSFKGIIMAEHPNHCWTNHHSIVEYQGQWLLFYHHNFFSARDDKRRSACIDRLTFNADGTIQEVKPTRRGVGIVRATKRIDIDCYSELGSGGSVAPHDSAPNLRGQYVTLPQKGWVSFADVDFSPVSDGYLVVSAKADDNTEFCLRERSTTGKVIARFKMNVKGDPNSPRRRDISGRWTTLTAPLDYTPRGVTSLVATCEGAPVSIDWLQVKNRPKYFTEVDKKAPAARPDDEGFVRRWRVMEPIPQDIRSNVVFTDSWLNQFFADEQAKLPKRKQRWHLLDSETYNLKLFRFAERWGQQLYGNLYWAEVTIDSPEEKANVRLAAGSNGASVWWLNGQEVLLLSGDRRMVRDDGMSARLTLKKGINTLRCAVVNGPGLSDMCVRFLDEEGAPVTNYKVVASK